MVKSFMDAPPKAEKVFVAEGEEGKVGTSFHNSSPGANGAGDPSKLGFSIAQIMGFMGSTKVKLERVMR